MTVGKIKRYIAKHSDASLTTDKMMLSIGDEVLFDEWTGADIGLTDGTVITCTVVEAAATTPLATKLDAPVTPSDVNSKGSGATTPAAGITSAASAGASVGAGAGASAGEVGGAGVDASTRASAVAAHTVANIQQPDGLEELAELEDRLAWRQLFQDLSQGSLAVPRAQLLQAIGDSAKGPQLLSSKPAVRSMLQVRGNFARCVCVCRDPLLGVRCWVAHVTRARAGGGGGGGLVEQHSPTQARGCVGSRHRNRAPSRGLLLHGCCGGTRPPQRQRRRLPPRRCAP